MMLTPFFDILKDAGLGDWHEVPLPPTRDLEEGSKLRKWRPYWIPVSDDHAPDLHADLLNLCQKCIAKGQYQLLTPEDYEFEDGHGLWVVDATSALFKLEQNAASEKQVQTIL